MRVVVRRSYPVFVIADTVSFEDGFFRFGVMSGGPRGAYRLLQVLLDTRHDDWLSRIESVCVSVRGGMVDAEI